LSTLRARRLALESPPLLSAASARALALLGGGCRRGLRARVSHRAGRTARMGAGALLGASLRLRTQLLGGGERPARLSAERFLRRRRDALRVSVAPRTPDGGSRRGLLSLRARSVQPPLHGGLRPGTRGVRRRDRAGDSAPSVAARHLRPCGTR